MGAVLSSIASLFRLFGIFAQQQPVETVASRWNFLNPPLLFSWLIPQWTSADGNNSQADANFQLMSTTRSIRNGKSQLYLNDRVLDALLGAAIPHLVSEFFKALEQEEINISAFYMEPIISRTVSEDLPVYDRLGRALARCGVKLSRVEVCLSHTNGVMEATATVLRHVRHTKALDWTIKLPYDPTRQEAASLTQALAGNSTIELVTVRDSPPSTGFLIALCDSLQGLGALRELWLVSSAKISLRQAMSLKEVAKARSLRTLLLKHVCFEDDEAAEMIGQAVAESCITKLKVIGGSLLATDAIAINLSMAIKCVYLRELDVSATSIQPPGNAMAFCRALAVSRIQVLKLHNFTIHIDAAAALGQAICRPCLTDLVVNGVQEQVFETLVSNIQSASSLRVLDVDLRGVTSQLRTLLGSLGQCVNLTEMSIWNAETWSHLQDLAAAKILTNCRKLVKLLIYLHSRAGFAELSFKSPLLLSAAKQHHVIESIYLLGTRRLMWSQLMQKELDRVTARNKETRIFLQQLATLSEDKAIPALVARVLYLVQSEPHLLYLALTTHNHHIAA